MKTLTTMEIENFKKATHCYICQEKFSETQVKIKEHCHLTGYYRGAACNKCNLQLRMSYNIPVVFHNLTNYDSHLLIRDIANNFEGEISIIPHTKEKYLAITKRLKGLKVYFTFIDSYNFLAESLAKLASYLKNDDLNYLKMQFKGVDENAFNLLRRKGVFPYEYINSMDVLKEKQLPDKTFFYTHLNNSHISDEDYEHAKQVWSTFNIKNLKEYLHLYLKIDIILLADIFENFRKNSIEIFQIDPAHYLSLPGYVFDACMYYTKIELELLTDVDMLLFIEKGIRGGLSQVSNRHAKANNKYIENYDANKPSSYISYFDVNNLYGYAMCQSLPYKEFEWVNSDEVQFFNVNDKFDENIGYTLEVAT